MITSDTASSRPALRRTNLLALGCALGLAFVPVAALRAADTLTPQNLADSAPALPSLPLTSSIEKTTGGENGPYVLKLKNTSTAAVKVTAKILLSVAFHAENKAKNLPEHTVEAGQVWSIADLAAADKVVLAAKGYAPLEIEVH
jgi:hypothetical protein